MHAYVELTEAGNNCRADGRADEHRSERHTHHYLWMCTIMIRVHAIHTYASITDINKQQRYRVIYIFVGCIDRIYTLRDAHMPYTCTHTWILWCMRNAISDVGQQSAVNETFHRVIDIIDGNIGAIHCRRHEWRVVAIDHGHRRQHGAHWLA